MKKNTYLGILTAITVICVIVGSLSHIIGFGYSLAENLNLPFFNEDTVRAEKTSNSDTTVDAFSNITVDANVMDLTITKGGSYSLNYSATKKLLPEYEVKNDTLTIRQQDTKISHLTGPKKQECSVTVTVPDSLKTIRIDANVGDIDLENISAVTLKVDTSTGDLDISGCTLEQVISDASVGDIDIEDCDFQNMKIDNDVGDVSISAGDLSDCRITLDTDMGSVTVNDKNCNRSFEQKGTGSRKLTVDNSTGDIELDYR